MADIDEIISGARGNTRYNFEAFGDPVKTYRDAQKQADETNLRRAFKDGVPTDENGQPDFAAMSKILFQKGGLDQGVAASNLDISRQQLKAGQALAEKMGQMEGGGQPTAPAIVSPPSSNRGASVPVAPPLNRGGVQSSGQPQSPQGGGTTIMGILSAQGIPNDQIGAASASIARQLGVEDPNAPIDVNNPQVRNVLVPAIQQLKRMGIGQVVQQQPQTAQAAPPQPPQQAQAVPQQPQAPATAQPAPNPQQNQGTFGAPSAIATRGAIPTGSDPEIQKQIANYTSIASNPAYPKSVQEAALTRLKALQEQGAPTGPMKEYDLYRRQGGNLPFKDWMDRTDDQTTQREILSKSLLPKLDKSQETATAARDDIDSIHRAREELDKAGGVYAGSFAEKRLQLAKLASYLGVQGADKIANTEAYTAAVGQRVAAMVKAFGSGTAISDGDRRFASEMAGGRIGLDEQSMRRILDIGERAARGKIDNHNKLVDNTMTANDALKPARDSYLVRAPGEYQKVESGKVSAVGSKADYDKLPSGATFTGPDGKQWRKP